MNEIQFQSLVERLDSYLQQLSDDREQRTRSYMTSVSRHVASSTANRVRDIKQYISKTNIVPDKPRDPYKKELGHIRSFSGNFATRRPEQLDLEFKPKPVKSSSSFLPALILPAVVITMLPFLPKLFDDDIDYKKFRYRHSPTKDTQNQTNRQRLNQINIPWKKIILGIGILSAGMSLTRQEKLQKLTGRLKKTHVRPAPRTTTKPPFSGKPTPQQKIAQQQKVKRMKRKGAARVKGSAKFIPLLVLPWLLGEQEVQAANERHKRDFYKGLLHPDVTAEYNRYLAEEHDWDNHPTLNTKRALDYIDKNLPEGKFTLEEREKHLEKYLQMLVDQHMGTWHAEQVKKETIEAEKQHFSDIQQKKEGTDRGRRRIRKIGEVVKSWVPLPRGGFGNVWPASAEKQKILTDEMGFTKESFESLDNSMRGMLLEDVEYRIENPGIRSPMEQEVLDYYNEEGGTDGWRKKEILEQTTPKSIPPEAEELRRGADRLRKFENKTGSLFKSQEDQLHTDNLIQESLAVAELLKTVDLKSSPSQPMSRDINLDRPQVASVFSITDPDYCDDGFIVDDQQSSSRFTDYWTNSINA